MIKSVLFDLDGLLIDSEYMCYKLFKALLKQYDIDFDKETYVNECAGHTAKATLLHFINDYHIPMTLEEGRAFMTQYEQDHFDDIGLKEGAKELLQYLHQHNISCLLATSSLSKRALSFLNKYHIQDLFDDFVFGPEVKRGKPYPDIFLKAIEKAHVEPHEALVLEDSEAGIEAAYSASIPVICVIDLYTPDKKHQEMIACSKKSLLDVIDYVENNR